MIDNLVREELLKAMERLSPGMQRRVLELARALRESWACGTPSSALLGFAGTMPPKEADELLRSIEEDYERSDPSEW